MFIGELWSKGLQNGVCLDILGWANLDNCKRHENGDTETTAGKIHTSKPSCFVNL